MTDNLTSSSSRNPPREFYSLPQLGFGSDANFEDISKHNRFLFRVYTPKERSPFVDDSDPYFIAPKFDEIYSSSPFPVPDWKSQCPHNGSYADAATHMEWTTRSSSVYISTTFSFIWAIWEALRRYHRGVKKDVQIAVIDAGALSGRAVTAIHLLRKGSHNERRRREYWNNYRFAQESQLVLVHAMIPGSAIFASIPLLSILEKLPAYFLRPDSQFIDGNPLPHIAWDYTQKKQSFRQFCQDMTERFFGLSLESRLRETTAGSVRLAISFLRPWFYRAILNDFEKATSTISFLAFMISQWPSQWWARDHSELWTLIQGVSITLGEEVRERYSWKVKEPESVLGDTFDDIESLVDVGYELVENSQIMEDTDWRTTPSIPFPKSHEDMAQPETPPETPAQRRLSFSRTPAISWSSFQLPLTPPASPRHSLTKRRPSFSSSITVPAISWTSFHLPLTPPESPRHSLSIPDHYFGAQNPISSSSPRLPDERVLDEGQDRSFGPVPSTSPSITSPTIVVMPSSDSPSMLSNLTLVAGVASLKDEADSSEHDICCINPLPTAAEQLDSDSLDLERDIQEASLAVITHTEEDLPPSVNTDLEAIEPDSPPSAHLISTTELLDMMLSSQSTSSQLRNDGGPSGKDISLPLVATVEMDSTSTIEDEEVSAYEDDGTTLPVTENSTSKSSLALADEVDCPSTSWTFTYPLGDLIEFHPKSGIAPPVSATQSKELIILPRDYDRKLTPALKERNMPSSHTGWRAIHSSLFPFEGRFPLRLPYMLLNQQEDEEEADEDQPTVSETASFLITGFLIGAFITLFLMGPQRRPLLHVT